MREGRVVVSISKLLAMSHHTVPMHRMFCLRVDCLHPDLKDKKYMHAISPPFFAVSKSRFSRDLALKRTRHDPRSE